MIKELLNKNGHPSITSDRWHVVHARCTGGSEGRPRFERTIVSEHDDRSAAASAARATVSAGAQEMSGLDPERRDQVFVRRPNYKSLKRAGRRGSRE